MAERDDAIAATLLASPRDPTPEVMPGRPVIANRYEILGLVGGGAMGTVYRARDRELDEIVALKVLKKELAGSLEIIERFRREVKLARRVTHRNVARTYDIGEDGGDRFLTMELIEGESLAAKVAREGRLPVKDVVAIAKDICSGLGAAHDAGILHRDLKPDNVIVTRDGRAVITDFGIARAAMDRGARTATGVFVGTPLYMAPEQVEGTTELDARADLYALGTMLYELVTGKAAWERDSIIATAAARLLTPPPDVRAAMPDLPPAFADLVTKLMARDREQRPPHADAVTAILEAVEPTTMPRIAVSTAPAPVRKKRVAVLPIVADRDDDAYLAYGLAEELRDVLSVVDGLAIRHVSQSAAAADRVEDAREAGRALDVDAVVSGTLQRAGDLFRVTLRVVTVADGFQLWARRLERAKRELLTVPGEAARAIAAALTTEVTAAVRVASSGDPEADDLYLRGKFLLYGSLGRLRDANATKVLRDAYERAPTDARIAGYFAIALARSYAAGHLGAGDPEPRAIALRALELDGTRPEARVALGTIYIADGDGLKAAVELTSALRVSLGSVDALDAMGRVLVEAGDAAEGLRLMELALTKEQIALTRNSIVRTLALLGEWERAWAIRPQSVEPGARTGSTLTQMRLAAWTRDLPRLRGLMREIREARLDPVLTSLAENVDAGDVPEAVVRATYGRIAEMMPRTTRRGIAFAEQLLVEGALVCHDVAGAMEHLRAADEAACFDVLWLDRCPLFEGAREHPTFREVRAHAGARAAEVLAAYGRARLSTRGRATRPT